MKKSIRVFSILVLAVAPAVAFAGAGGTTCATAEILASDTTYTGDTSAPGYGNPVGGFGPLPSPSNDAIYTFTNHGSHGNVEVIAAGYNYGIFLTTNCTGTTDQFRLQRDRRRAACRFSTTSPTASSTS